jgi:hypothetical protein
MADGQTIGELGPGAMSTLAWTCLTRRRTCFRKRKHGTQTINRHHIHAVAVIFL